MCVYKMLSICESKQSDIWTDVIQFYNIINSTDLVDIISLDNVSILKRALGRVGIIPTSGLWYPAITHHSFKIMEYLASERMYCPSDVERAALIGDLCCIKYLTKNLLRPPTRQSVVFAASEGHLKILQYFRMISNNNSTLKQEIWTTKATLLAFMNGRLESLNILEDTSLWSPDMPILHS